MVFYRGYVAQRIEHQVPVLGVGGSTPSVLVQKSGVGIPPALPLPAHLYLLTGFSIIGTPLWWKTVIC